MPLRQVLMYVVHKLTLKKRIQGIVNVLLVFLTPTAWYLCVAHCDPVLEQVRPGERDIGGELLPYPLQLALRVDVDVDVDIVHGY